MRKNKESSGYTLIEFMVVITLVVILAGTIMMTFTNARRTSRDEQRVADIRVMTLAFQQYRTQCGEYPEDLSGVGVNNGCPPGISLGTFIPELPNTGFQYHAMSKDKGSRICYNYHIGITLETAHSALDGDDDFDSRQVTFGGGGSNPIFACNPGPAGFNGSDAGNVYDLTR